MFIEAKRTVQAVLYKKLCLESEANLLYDMKKKKVEDLLGESSTLSQSISSKESCLQKILNQEDLLKPVEEFPNTLSELTDKYEEILNSNTNKQNLSAIELFFENQSNALYKTKVDPNLKDLSDLQNLKSCIDFKYQDNCLYFINNKPNDQEIKIDLKYWIEAKKLIFTFEKEISQKDLTLIAYIWENMKNPLVLQLKFAKKTLTKDLYTIFCSDRHNFKDIRIEIRNYEIDSESLMVPFIREIFLSAKNIITVDINMKGTTFADESAEMMFKNVIFDTTNLKNFSLNLSETNLKDQDLKDLFIARPQLNTFRFAADCSLITDGTIISFIKNTLASTQFLQTIYISLYSTQVTDACIESFSSHLNSTKITSLILFLGDTHITDRSVELLSNTMLCLNMFNTLCEFVLDLSNNDISDKSLKQIFLQMPNARKC